jgi:hypothetical protein
MRAGISGATRMVPTPSFVRVLELAAAREAEQGMSRASERDATSS